MTHRRRPETSLAHAGRDPWNNHGILNPPVYHASTIASRTLADWEARESRRFETYTYGRIGTPTSEAFESAMAESEGGYRAVSVSSGLSAITTALLAFLKGGDHLLMVDTAYGPTRRFCDVMLKRYGVETTYYDPLVGADIAALVRPTTRVIFLESPGSLTFEVQDVPAIAAVARDRGIVTMIDNTWATPLFFRPIEHGVDLSIHAATKYICGHSDVNLGVVIARDHETFLKVKTASSVLGVCAGPDDLYLGARGLRTLAARMARHQENALTVAGWMQSRPEVDRVLYPALPADPGHALWRRDFAGACGLFSAVLRPVSKPALAAMVDGLELFPLGASWGGYESLIMTADPAHTRSATPWTAEGPMLRLHIGLEDPVDLIGDLTAGFERMAAHATV
ncbi:MAG: cystathionine beta-lyase [Rhodospirillaceae bacterium]|nr:cystathionine beta-lyase [Rhodospirillaceae bacterium]